MSPARPAEERLDDPVRSEVVDVPAIADDEVLVYVMAAGVNYNNVWAALGMPIDVIGARNKAGEPERFHIGGSDASGVGQFVESPPRGVPAGRKRGPSRCGACNRSWCWR